MKTAFQKQKKGSAVLREPTLTDRRLHRFDTQSDYLRQVCYLEVRQEETEDTYTVHFCKTTDILQLYISLYTLLCYENHLVRVRKRSYFGSKYLLSQDLLPMIRWFPAYKC